MAARRKPHADLPADPYESAKVAGLRYVTADRPGITRKRRGKGFEYFGPDKKPVRDKTTLDRISSLVIPLAPSVAVDAGSCLAETANRPLSKPCVIAAVTASPSTMPGPEFCT